jgi:hypothetical protein
MIITINRVGLRTYQHPLVHIINHSHLTKLRHILLPHIRFVITYCTCYWAIFFPKCMQRLIFICINLRAYVGLIKINVSNF